MERGTMSSSQIVVKVDPDLKRLLKVVAKARGEDISDFVRRAIKAELARLSFLNEEERKALGIEVKVESAFEVGR